MTQLEEIDKELTDSKFYELCNIMGKKWVLLILISIYANIHTFSGIMKAVPKINTSILTNRLNELVDKWFVIRTAKSEYHLSEQGTELMEWLKSLKERATQTRRDNPTKKNK